MEKKDQDWYSQRKEAIIAADKKVLEDIERKVDQLESMENDVIDDLRLHWRNKDNSRYYYDDEDSGLEGSAVGPRRIIYM